VTTSAEASQCRCGRPLFRYWYRDENGQTRAYAQQPIIPGPSSELWAVDLFEAKGALGLTRATLVHDVNFVQESGRSKQGACVTEAWRMSTPMSPKR
jgi:hypothetical protein